MSTASTIASASSEVLFGADGGEESTIYIAQCLARAAQFGPGDVVFLKGPLGCGKTTLVRALLRSLTGDESLVVPSPTFLLDVCYPFKRLEGSFSAVHHMDLYRISPAPRVVTPGEMLDRVQDDERTRREQELSVLDLQRIFQNELSFVEWPDRLQNTIYQPQDRLEISFELKPSGRQVRLRAVSETQRWSEERLQTIVREILHKAEEGEEGEEEGGGEEEDSNEHCQRQL